MAFPGVYAVLRMTEKFFLIFCDIRCPLSPLQVRSQKGRNKHMEDERIVKLFWERSQEALAQTQQKYGRLLRRVAGNILEDPRDAEEAVSDAYMRLWNAIPPARPQNLTAFAVRLSRNAAFDLARQKHRKKRDDRSDLLFSELDECIPSREDTAARLEERELAELMNRWLGTLDGDSRRLFVRRYFYQDGLEELAADFGLTKHNVSVRLYRLRQGLKRCLEKEGVAV